MLAAVMAMRLRKTLVRAEAVSTDALVTEIRRVPGAVSTAGRV
jgi:hypothetical protein